MEGEIYDGIPLERLPLEEVHVPDELHLRRSLRYRGALDIEPEHAVEAVFDPRRLIGRDPPDGVWHVATAWPADKRVRQAYRGLRGVR
ncbi:hypothetical protein H4696_006928 [Amycolatopsis lexingtonensis]|uniref:Transposase n=1 Tax=Amycolatopsis lexingtonensis TaxID=218822 RepID=A0ABR9I9G6_9PSEU|nr:hypothetical protein [Amycolatopsis lexingtonensis]MBE1499828.1 hypothetical protein [Amycolatopsis lexingtonensis]